MTYNADDLRREAGDVDPVEQAERLRYIGVPEADESILLHGKIGRWAREAAVNSEASPLAMFMNMVSYCGTCFGREAELWLDSPHHPRFFWLHVGRTAVGRKGTASAPVEYQLHAQLMKIDEVERQFAATNGKETPKPLAPHWHSGGLSTREGLAWRIRDEVKEQDDDGNETVKDAGVEDKRLYLVETEFENTLQHASRDGNTLSSGLRDTWDGRDLAPLTKTNRTTASKPHVGLTAHITPSELLTILKDRHVTNGFLNRFAIVWAERSRLIPRPKPATKDQAKKWATELAGAIHWVRRNRPEMTLSDAASKLYDKTYLQEWGRPPHSDVTAALTERAAPNALRLAMILAILDQSKEIGEDHLVCAIAWTRYWRASVEYIWRERVRLSEGNGAAQDTITHARKIYAFLKARGEPVFRTDLVSDCFHRHVTATDLDLALEWMQLQTPSLIRVSQVPKKGKPNQTATVVSLAEKQQCEPGEPGECEATTRPSHIRNGCEPGEPDKSHSPHSQDMRMSESRASTTHSPHSPHSQGVFENERIGGEL